MRPIRFKDKDVKNFSEYNERIIKVATFWSEMTNKSLPSCYDQVKAIVRAHALLNKRNMILEDEFEFLSLVEPNIVAPDDKKKKILTLYRQNKNYDDICKELGENPDTFQGQISRVIKDFKQRGVID